MLLLLLACSSKDDDKPNKHGGQNPGTSSWTVPSATEPPPFDAAALEEGLALALDEVLTLSAEPVLASYEAMMAYADGYCPYIYPPYDSSSSYYAVSEFWYAQCNTPLGATFAGDGGYAATEDDSYRSVYLAGTIIAPNGQTMTGSGYWAHGTDNYSGMIVYGSFLDGALTYDGPEAAGTWIERQIQPNELDLNVVEMDGARSVYVEGQFTGLPGPVDTVDFSGIELDSSYGCPEPWGSIALRMASGTDWFDVAFGEDCDGCGIASWQGLEMGTVCGDFAAWLEVP